MKEIKIVTPKEMARIEKLAIQNGYNEEEFVIRAGRAVADAAEKWMGRHRHIENIVIVAGKGHKGADAFASGIEFHSRGYRVKAYHLDSMARSKPLCRKLAERFREMGGDYTEVRKASDLAFGLDSLIVDGLLGTGFTGDVEGLYKAAIETANRSKMPIVSIDIPSGLDGSTGAAKIAMDAQLTVAMGLPKIGFFLGDGWNLVGELLIADFGLPEEFAEAAKESAFMPCMSMIHQLLPAIKRNRHKYHSCVVGYAGSRQFSGAAKLASLAALRGGAGIVKLFFPPDAEAHMMDAPYEVIRLPWTKNDWSDALFKAKSVFIGPGIGSGEETQRFVKSIVYKMKLPIVLDADALFKGVECSPASICTPHRGEMLRLLGKENIGEDRLLKECQHFCDEKRTVLVLKGAPTWIFSPRRKPTIIAHGDPGMATAGSGDVLTGLLAALLAQGCKPLDAAVLGTALHALAGEKAAHAKTSHCMIASDLIEHFPHAFKECYVTK